MAAKAMGPPSTGDANRRAAGSGSLCSSWPPAPPMMSSASSLWMLYPPFQSSSATYRCCCFRRGLAAYSSFRLRRLLHDDYDDGDLFTVPHRAVKKLRPGPCRAIFPLMKQAAFPSFLVELSNLLQIQHRAHAYSSSAAARPTGVATRHHVNQPHPETSMAATKVLLLTLAVALLVASELPVAVTGQKTT
ncbi:hypothetical protein EJB05_10499, partial [Eragrostis curvula]